jgi:hypothetical protein
LSPPANQNVEPGSGPLQRPWTRAGDCARVEKTRQGHNEALSGHSPDETDCREGRDTWLTELLARASREEDEDCHDFAPPWRRRG